MSLFTYLPKKMEQTECSETSAYKIQKPGNYPEESIQHTEHGESLKSRIYRLYLSHKINRPLSALEERCFLWGTNLFIFYLLLLLLLLLFFFLHKSTLILAFQNFSALEERCFLWGTNLFIYFLFIIIIIFFFFA